MKLFGKKNEIKPSMRRRLVFSLGSVASILLLSGLISIFEYRRMSDYVSELISSNIKSINLSQRLADMTQEYDVQMLAVVLMNDISLMPKFDLQLFQTQADSLKNSVTSMSSLPIVDTVAVSFDEFMKTSLMFDEVFLTAFSTADLAKSSKLEFSIDEILSYSKPTLVSPFFSQTASATMEAVGFTAYGCDSEPT